LQKNFNITIKRLQQKKQELELWADVYTKAMSLNVDEILPIESTIETKKFDFLILIDQAYETMPLTVNQKKKLTVLIAHVARILLSNQDNELVEAIFDKYADKNYQEYEDEYKSALREELEFMCGVNLDDHFDIDDPDAISQLQEKIQENSQHFHQPKREKRKTKKQIEKESKAEEEKKSTAQSVREVFRQLAKALHPDREMDTDKKLRKHELMQRANVAYQKEDLFTLLSLQLEIEQIDQNHIDNLASEKLLYFNKILSKQFNDIKNEISELKMKYAYELKVPHEFLNKPDDLVKIIESKKMHFLSILRCIHRDIDLCSDTKAFKKYVTSLKMSNFENY
jgi:hypothetical protein